MKLSTFEKRFNFPVKHLKGLVSLMTNGKNGKWYSIVIDKNGLPVATEIKL